MERTPTGIPSAETIGPSSKRGVPSLAFDEEPDVEATLVAPSDDTGDVSVEPLIFGSDRERDGGDSIAGLTLVSAAARSERGQLRKKNEDCQLARSESGLFVVADGMGGYAGGELASQIAVDVIGNAFEKNAFTGPEIPGVRPAGGDVVRALRMANSAILEKARSTPSVSKMGTTVTVARFSPDKRHLYIGHVGDSRCYELRGTTLRLLTRDHTMAHHGVAGHAGKQLSRAVGIRDEVGIDLSIEAPEPGDLYLLCTDGLTKMVPKEAIRQALIADVDLDQMVNKLLELCERAGGRDNVTLVLVRMVGTATA